MYKNVLRAIADVGVFGSISIIIFFVFFMIVLFFVLRMKKSTVQHIENLPLQD
jgi:cbb3-type cytochrome oxidase subunit 3